MAVISGINIKGYRFTIEHDTLDIKYCYLGDGGVNVWPILSNEIIMIF